MVVEVGSKRKMFTESMNYWINILYSLSAWHREEPPEIIWIELNWIRSMPRLMEKQNKPKKQFLVQPVSQENSLQE